MTLCDPLISTTTITTKQPMEIKNPLDSTIEISIPLNSTEYFYHFPCAPAMFQSEDLNNPIRDFHHFSAAVRFNMIQQTLALLMDYPVNISLYCQ